MKNRTLFSIMTGLVVFVLLISGVCLAQDDFCNYVLTPPNHAVGAQAEAGNTVNVTFDHRCGWTAFSNDYWITITGIGAETNKGFIMYSVAANPGPNPRRGTITMAGKTFIVSQASPVPVPCKITLSDDMVVGWRHFTHRFKITASPTCPWTITSSVPWITIRTSSPNHGTILAVFDITENSGSTPRAGRILVNGKDLLVTQVNQ